MQTEKSKIKAIYSEIQAIFLRHRNRIARQIFLQTTHPGKDTTKPSKTCQKLPETTTSVSKLNQKYRMGTKSYILNTTDKRLMVPLTLFTPCILMMNLNHSEGLQQPSSHKTNIKFNLSRCFWTFKARSI